MGDDDLRHDDSDSPPERDPNTGDMFGDAPLGSAPAATDDSAAYTVIARKYRPKTFDDLYGQEAMVRTLKNAFASGRIAHAFMLTGVRGVGKTTTARLLARALNYETDTLHEPTLDLRVEGRHCKAIIEGRHMDVLELDAASRTGVADMRDLLDGVRYAPVEARYKVYIIDEVHMLSTGAFNALLKTLEEPPPHTLIVLVSDRPARLLQTIRSRCRLLARDLAAPEEVELRRRLMAELARPSGADPLGFAPAVDRAAVERFVYWLQTWVNDLLLVRLAGTPRHHVACAAALSARAKNADVEALFDLERELAEARRLASHPLNPRLLAEHLLMAYNRATLGAKP